MTPTVKVISVRLKLVLGGHTLKSIETQVHVLWDGQRGRTIKIDQKPAAQRRVVGAV